MISTRRQVLEDRAGALQLYVWLCHMLEWTCAVTEVMPVVCHSLGFPLRVSVTCAYFTLFIWMVPDFLDK